MRFIVLTFCLLLAATLFAQPNRTISLISEAMVTGSYEAVKVVDDRLWCANQYGVVVYDLANWDPANLPTEIAHFPTPGRASGLFIADSLCYVADGQKGLGIYDITDLNAVKKLCAYEGATPAVAVIVRDGVAFVLGYRSGIYAVDVSNPRRPRLQSFYQVRNEKRTLVLRDNLLWMTTTGEGAYEYLTAFDISNPRNISQFVQYTDRPTSVTSQQYSWV